MDGLSYFFLLLATGALQVAGLILAARYSVYFLVFPVWLAPAIRFGSLRSFSLLLSDFTFNTVDDGLHMDISSIIKAIMYILVLPDIVSKFLRKKRKHGRKTELLCSDHDSSQW